MKYFRRQFSTSDEFVYLLTLFKATLLGKTLFCTIYYVLKEISIQGHLILKELNSSIFFKAFNIF